MFKSNYLYNKLVELCDINGIAPSIWAEKNNLNNALPTLLKRGVRPNPSTLNKLITSFKAPEDRMELMAAHLKDEIIRGGLSLNVIYPTISSKKKIQRTRSRFGTANDIRFCAESTNPGFCDTNCSSLKSFRGNIYDETGTRDICSINAYRRAEYKI